MSDERSTVVHQPVLVEKVLEGLSLRTGAVVLDATVGWGGHAEKILEAIGPGGFLVGLDRDQEALRFAEIRLAKFRGSMKLLHRHFSEAASALEALHVERLDAALFDLGVSSPQLETPERGFSFLREGPLDMRMDQDQGFTAADLVNHASPEELIRLLQEAEVQGAKRIVRAMVRGRPFATTTSLAQVVRQAAPFAGRGRIDPATLTFQAIRIAVNRELEGLPQGLKAAASFLRPGGRLAVLAYHSLEDRIVKQFFRGQARAGGWKVLTRKPIRPGAVEIKENPRSRSARLRIAQRISAHAA